MSEGKPPSKSQIYASLSEETGLTKKQVSTVFETLAAMIQKELSQGKKSDPKSFTIPGLCKIITKFKPADKGGQTKVNPFTGEQMITKPKEASQQVKIRPLKALKDMV